MSRRGRTAWKAHLLFSATFLLAQPVLAQRWQPPPGAKIYRQRRVPVAGDEILKVVFYSVGVAASATLLSPQGRELDTVCVDLNLGFQEPTGVYHLKNDDSWQFVLFGQVGAKAHEAKVYDLRGGKLVELFEWSGWSFRLVTLERKQMIAAQVYQRRPPADLYMWRDGRFQKVNSDFPSFYGHSSN